MWHRGKRVDRPDTLLYGRLYLPQSTLEALYLRRLSPTIQLKLSCVSDSKLPNGGSILAHLHHDTAKHSTEYLYSTDSLLFGLRGLYNFGSEDTNPEDFNASSTSTQNGETIVRSQTLAKPHGRFSAGGEVYYGLLNKSGGLSTGLRFATLPSHTGFPYTMTLTINPLMGGLSSTYSVLAQPTLALSSRFDFNVYSYESKLQVGTELWRTCSKPAGDLDWVRRMMAKELTPIAEHGSERDAHLSGCLKARLDHRGSLALLWEGRVKALLYSCGVTVDPRDRENMFKGLGMELHYSP